MLVLSFATCIGLHELTSISLSTNLLDITLKHLSLQVPVLYITYSAYEFALCGSVHNELPNGTNQLGSLT